MQCNCGGKFNSNQIPCPEKREGCIVMHWGWVCDKCGYVLDERADYINAFLKRFGNVMQQENEYDKGLREFRERLELTLN